MNTVPLKLVTIVAESVLEPYLIEDIRKLGAKGYTLTRAEGRGSRGVRVDDVERGNIKLEAIVGPEVADKILELLAEKYFQHYAVIAYLENVEVVRGDKYV
jgi:nitrogen regulatory protein PII